MARFGNESDTARTCGRVSCENCDYASPDPEGHSCERPDASSTDVGFRECLRLATKMYSRAKSNGFKGSLLEWQMRVLLNQICDLNKIEVYSYFDDSGRMVTTRGNVKRHCADLLIQSWLVCGISGCDWEVATERFYSKDRAVSEHGDADAVDLAAHWSIIESCVKDGGISSNCYWTLELFLLRVLSYITKHGHRADDLKALALQALRERENSPRQLKDGGLRNED